MNKEKLLQLRKEIKSKKPNFERQEVNNKPQFRGQWRSPKGITSKMRRGFRGNKRIPALGYGSPKLVKGLTKSGLKPILVHNLNDLKLVEKDCVAVIASDVGMKKSLIILTKSKEMNLKVLGIKDINGFLDKAKENVSSRKKLSEFRKEEKKKKLVEANKDKEETKNKVDIKKEDEKTEEDKRIDPYLKTQEKLTTTKKKLGVKKDESKK